MEALASSTRVKSYAGPKDKVPEHGRLVRVEIESRNGTSVEGGHVVPPGTHWIDFPEEHVDKLHALVEDEPELIEQAKEAFEKVIDREVADGSRGEWSVLDVRAARKAPNPDGEQQSMIDAREACYDTTPSSVEAQFYAANDREIRPFISVKVGETKEYTEQATAAARAVESNTALAAAILQGLQAGGVVPKPEAKKGK